MENKIKIKSLRLDKELEVEVYQKDDVLIIRHTSLENIFWNMDDATRPEMTVDTVDLARLPGIPPMFAVRCRLKDPVSGREFEQFGEMLCSNWQCASKITHDFPLTMCKNQAFDRCFVRYLQFDISGFKAIALYSDSEIEIPRGSVPCEVVPEQESAGNEAGHSVIENTAGPARIPDAETIPASLSYANLDFPEQAPSIPSNTMPESDLDIWAGMNMDETIEAYGSGQDTGPYADAFLEQGTVPDNSSPFPWNTQPVMPCISHDTIQAPKLQGMLQGETAPQVPESLRKLTVYEVGFDFGTGNTVIGTDGGTITFDPFNGFWDSKDVSLGEVDMDDLYRKASTLAGKDLREYNGPSLP